jgi:SAM-dependent methyltransferase
MSVEENINEDKFGGYSEENVMPNIKSNYIYENIQTRGAPLFPLIALHGKDIVGLELGCWRAENIISTLISCKNVKHLYGVDSWEPYVLEKYNRLEIVDIKAMEVAKFFAKHHVNYSGVEDKITILEKKSSDAVKDFEDSSLDFIFFDISGSYKSNLNDLNIWYDKIKDGGILCGIDWEDPAVRDSINNLIASLLLSFILYSLLDIIQSTQATLEFVTYMNPAQIGVSPS